MASRLAINVFAFSLTSGLRLELPGTDSRRSDGFDHHPGGNLLRAVLAQGASQLFNTMKKCASSRPSYLLGVPSPHRNGTECEWLGEFCRGADDYIRGRG